MMNKTDAKRLKSVKRFFGKYEEGYGLVSDDVEWLIKQVEQLQKLGEVIQNFETTMDKEMDWHDGLIEAGKRRQFHVGSLSGWRNAKRQWEFACWALKGGVQNGKTHET